MAEISPAEFIEHIGRESDRFLDALRTVPGSVPVPSCPDWDVDDLMFHLTEVQHFWGTIVADRLQTEGEVDAVTSERPEARADLETLFAQNAVALVAALRAATPETAVWTWSPDKTVGFVCRRQAHEALIHRVDAELAAKNRTPLNPTLAADGVHEALGVMYGAPPPWGRFTPNPDRVVRVSAIDTGDVWTVTVGRFVGTSPAGKEHDIGCLDWAPDDAAPGAEVVGAAGDLDCWLWGRTPLGEVSLSGEEATCDALVAIVTGGIQ